MENEIELALIGCLLKDQSLILVAAEIVKPRDFSCRGAQIIYSKILEQWRACEPVSFTTIRTDESSAYCQRCVNSSGIVGPSFVASHAKKIAAQAKESRIRKGIADILNLEGDIETRMDLTSKLLQEEHGDHGKDHDIAAVDQRVDDFIFSGAGKGFSTGIDFYDEKFVRFCQPRIWVVGAWTSVGKTAFMIQLLANQISSPHKKVVFSTEMTEEQIMARLIGNLSGVSPNRYLMDKLMSGEKERIDAARKIILKSNLKIYDDIYKISELERALKAEALRGGVPFAAVDYVQNLQGEGRSDYERSADMAKRLQTLAKVTKSNLLLLSQVANEDASGESEVVKYKGAGEWSAVADVGIILKRVKENPSWIKAEMGKNRHGQLVSINLEYQANYTRLECIGEVKSVR